MKKKQFTTNKAESNWRHICITAKAMHHQPGVWSQHRRTGSSVPSAVPNGTLIRESCRPAGRKRLFYTYFGAVYSQILTQQRQIWSALGDPASPSFWQISLKSIKRLRHTRRKASKSRIRILCKKNTFKIRHFSHSPQRIPSENFYMGAQPHSFRYTKA